jgi:hypothetical protein
MIESKPAIHPTHGMINNLILANNKALTAEIPQNLIVRTAEDGFYIGTYFFMSKNFSPQ